MGTLDGVTGTWIETAAGGTTEALVALRPELADLLAALEAGATASVGARLQALLAVRVAQMVGDEPFVVAADPVIVEQARQWPTHSAVTDVERAALDLCESFVMDAHSVTDEQVVRLQGLVGDQGTIDVLLNLAVLDGFTKFRRVFAEGSQ